MRDFYAKVIAAGASEEVLHGWDTFRDTLAMSVPQNKKAQINDLGFDLNLVEVSGIEPLTSCMPCKRSPS